MFEKYILKPILNSFEKYPDCNSFCIGDVLFSYSCLAKTISKIRTELQCQSTESGHIGIVANDDIETYAGILAIWLEGYAYVPIHPNHPVKRGRKIMEQAEINLIVDSSEETFIPGVKCIKSKELEFTGMNLDPVRKNDDDLAYILFTSGSTGKPKGVPITRGNLGAFMKAFWDIGIQLDNNDRCLQCFDLTFDVSVQSFVAPLIKGACIYTIPHDRIKPIYAANLVEEQKLTFGAMAPSMIRSLRPYFDEFDFTDLRYNILTAEASPLDLIEEWAQCIPNAEIIDLYGPTEATIYCTYYKFDRNGGNKDLNGMLCIGKPLQGITAIIADEDRNILPANQKGELCIAGDQLTKGYWNTQKKNQQAFFMKEINGVSLRFYRTGDSCYMDNDGDLMLAGRLDYQVKIQGYRIELGEIEYHAREFVKGQNAVAIAFNNSNGIVELALFIEGRLDDYDELNNYLMGKMPYYMVPSVYYTQDEFPLNTNGKVDRKKLKHLVIH
ncbi:AMP-binding protein [Saccharicrinis sp. GN24d3]|uniref:AMP-binding protein n=1 Tax=Saccharicrinis sp. GN24d3 TaxID=3458416 RepID=UPI004036534F